MIKRPVASLRHCRGSKSAAAMCLYTCSSGPSKALWMLGGFPMSSLALVFRRCALPDHPGSARRPLGTAKACLVWGRTDRPDAQPLAPVSASSHPPPPAVLHRPRHGLALIIPACHALPPDVGIRPRKRPPVTLDRCAEGYPVHLQPFENPDALTSVTR